MLNMYYKPTKRHESKGDEDEGYVDVERFDDDFKSG